MIRIAIVLGSTRPGRLGKAVADWVHSRASERGDATFDVLDVADFGLPHPRRAAAALLRPVQPAAHQGLVRGCRRDSTATSSSPGEYNHSIPGALKNAVDYLYKEWNNKAAGFVSYGSSGGIRAVEHFRAVAAELQMADVRAQVALPLATEFANYRTFIPTAAAEKNLQTLFDQVIAWAGALKVLRPDHAHGKEDASAA